jgi:hypothetical protein
MMAVNVSTTQPPLVPAADNSTQHMQGQGCSHHSQGMSLLHGSGWLERRQSG